MDSNTVVKAKPAPSVKKWNPFDRAYNKNLHDYLHDLRSVKDLRTINGYRLFVDYKTVKLLLNHENTSVLELTEVFPQKREAVTVMSKDFPSLSRMTRRWPVLANDPHHAQLRNVLTAIWRQSELMEAVNKFVELTVKNIPLNTPFDWIPFSEELPIFIISQVLGFPLSDKEKLRNWSKGMAWVTEPFANMYDFAEINKEFENFEKYLNIHLDTQIQNPSLTCLIGRLCQHVKSNNLDWTHEDMVSLLTLIFFSAIETSIIFFGGALLELSKAPHIWEEVCADPSLTPVLTEELLRMTSPLSYTSRKVDAPIELEDGTVLKKGDWVFLSFIGANRDPLVFEHPDSAVLRQPNPHLAFGHGSHYCFGSRIARVEATALLKALALKKIKISLLPQELDFDKGIYFKKLNKLQVVFKSDAQ